MAVDAFLKIDGIVGDHKGEIQLESFSWGVSNSSTICRGGGGGGAGRASFQDFSFTSQIGSQSPSLFLSAATGIHHKVATLTVPELIEIKLSDVLVSSYKEDLSILHKQEGGTRFPLEFVSLNFAKIEVTVGRASANFDICEGRGGGS